MCSLFSLFVNLEGRLFLPPSSTSLLHILSFEMQIYIFSFSRSFVDFFYITNIPCLTLLLLYNREGRRVHCFNSWSHGCWSPLHYVGDAYSIRLVQSTLYWDRKLSKYHYSWTVIVLLSFHTCILSTVWELSRVQLFSTKLFSTLHRDFSRAFPKQIWRGMPLCFVTFLYYCDSNAWFWCCLILWLKFVNLL